MTQGSWCHEKPKATFGLSWLGQDCLLKLIVHHAELQDLVERDDTAARLPAAATMLKVDGSEQCSVSADMESAVHAESPEVRYRPSSNTHVLEHGAMCCRYSTSLINLCTTLWRDGFAQETAVTAADAPCAGSGQLRQCWWSSRPLR